MYSSTTTSQPARRFEGYGVAILAGIVTAVCCAGVWGLIAYLSKYQFGYAALGVGFLVGTIMVRVSGGARGLPLGIASAIIAVFGCALGSLVAEVLGLVGEHIPLSAVLTHMNLVLRAYPHIVGALGFLFWIIAAFYGLRSGMGLPLGRRRRALPSPYGTRPAPGTPEPFFGDPFYGQERPGQGPEPQAAPESGAGQAAEFPAEPGSMRQQTGDRPEPGQQPPDAAAP